MDVDDEVAVGKPELQRDVFASGIRLEKRLPRGIGRRFFELLESLRRREIVHRDEGFNERVRESLGPHEELREGIEVICVRQFGWRKGETAGIEVGGELLEETREQWTADAFEDAGLVKAFEFECCHRIVESLIVKRLNREPSCSFESVMRDT